MSAMKIIKNLEELVGIHENLLEISKEKTEVIKEGVVEKLQKLLVKERKQIRASERVESERQKAVEAWCMENDLPLDKATITEIIGKLPDEKERSAIEKAATDLTTVITELKRQEQLNEALLNQSMEFVQLSLDLLSPSLKNLNYGMNKQSDHSARSVFDSKA